MFLQLLLSTVIVIKASTVVPATADLLNETFDNATNYDDATWTATVASSGVVDPNETVLCPASGTGWGSECLQMNTGAANRKAYVMNDLGSARADAIYTTYRMGHNRLAHLHGRDNVVIGDPFGVVPVRRHVGVGR
jgi:hypothetical protein